MLLTVGGTTQGLTAGGQGVTKGRRMGSSADVFPTLESFFQRLRETFQTHKGLTSQRFSEFLGCQQDDPIPAIEIISTKNSETIPATQISISRERFVLKDRVLHIAT